MLVSYDTAAEHLRLGDLKADTDTMHTVTRMLAQAEGLVLRHIKYVPTEPPEWSEATDPALDGDFAIVQAAILTVLGNFYRFRGDDEVSAAGNGPLTPRVAELLSQLRDPTVA